MAGKQIERHQSRQQIFKKRFQCQGYRQRVDNSPTLHFSSRCFTSALASLRSKRFRCGLGTKNEERESKTTRKMGRVKERGVSGSRSIFAWPKAKIPFHVVPRPFLAPIPWQKRLLRRLPTPRVYMFHGRETNLCFKPFHRFSLHPFSDKHNHWGGSLVKSIVFRLFPPLSRLGGGTAADSQAYFCPFSKISIQGFILSKKLKSLVH